MMTWLIKWIGSAMGFALAIYFYIDAHNRLIQVQLAIPPLEKKMRDLIAENERLQYEIDRFESPSHLMELAKEPEFSHLKAPYKGDILIVPLKKESP